MRQLRPRIVVGVDGSPNSRAALRWAIEEARLRRATVVAVHAWTLPSAGELTEVTGPLLLDEAERQAGEVLETAIAAVTEDDGDVIERELPQGPAGISLVEACGDAALLVVGSRGHGGLARLVLGSVSSHVAHHAHCPVVIVPPADQ